MSKIYKLSVGEIWSREYWVKGETEIEAIDNYLDYLNHGNEDNIITILDPEYVDDAGKNDIIVLGEVEDA